jgi:hypothetical protein
MIGGKLGWAMLLTSVVGCAFDTAPSSDEAPVGELSQELQRSALTPSQQATVLDLIDDICGDTWCEGDHNFSFDRLRCRNGCPGRPGRCEMTFRVFSYDTDVETGPTFVRSCETTGFTGFESLVQTQGSYQSLQPAYYDALTECISRIESELRQ